MIRMTVAAAMLLTALTSQAVAETYACMEAAASGFEYKDSAWKTTRFVEQKFILTIDGSNVFLKPDIFSPDQYTCEKVWPVTAPYLLRCVSATNFLIFNEETLRFTISFNYGEAGNSATQNFRDSMRIGYGICQPFK